MTLSGLTTLDLFSTQPVLSWTLLRPHNSSHPRPDGVPEAEETYGPALRSGPRTSQHGVNLLHIGVSR